MMLPDAAWVVGATWVALTLIVAIVTRDPDVTSGFAYLGVPLLLLLIPIYELKDRFGGIEET